MATPRTTTTFTRYKNAKVKFIEAPLWLDGTPLSDSKNAEKFDDILFKRKVISGKAYYYKRQHVPDVRQMAATQGPGYFYNLADWGVSATNSGEVNHERFQGLLNYLPMGYSIGLYIPEGRYEIAKTLNFNGRPLQVCGVWGGVGNPGLKTGSRLVFPAGVTGIYADRGDGGYQDYIFKDIALEAAGEKTDVWASGMDMRARCSIIRCSTMRFNNHGVQLFGDLGIGSDTSGSQIIKHISHENGQDGIFLGHVDGNMVNVTGADVATNGRWGIFDSSFLGVKLDSCMAHYNGMNQKAYEGGDFSTRDYFNARSLYINLYSEGHNNKDIFSHFGHRCTVVGGTWGTGYKLTDFAEMRHGSYDPKL